MDEALSGALDAFKAIQLNDGTFSSEIIDGELILLNRYEGIYYSAGGSIAEIWPMLVSGASLASVIDEAKQMFDGKPEGIAAEILGLVKTLVEENIVFQIPPGESAEVRSGTPARPFAPFNFEKYADLQDILTLDPLHDVDVVSGWPTPRK